MYLKTIERLGLYISTHFKNGSDVKKCLKLGKIVSQWFLIYQMYIPPVRKEYGSTI